MIYPTEFDVIIIGGGHAGTEAALAAARMGVKTLLLTHNLDTIGQMSCNPAIGGIGKGHLVKEIDAMGGVMAAAADASGIQFRILNSRKGAAVRATRAQADRSLYKKAIRQRVDAQENLTLFQQSVDDLIIKGDKIAGVVTQTGIHFYAQTVVLTVGTFLGGKIHIGTSHCSGGRAGDPPATALAQRLREMPLRVARLKTGTPPRIDAKTTDFSVMGIQKGDTPVPVFSYLGRPEQHPPQVPCHITYTNEKTHDIIRRNLDKSPIYSGAIDSIGPRYCPSIEDKIVRFADKDRHQIFVEPEGLTVQELYPNGISTSLPFEVQYEIVRSIKGFEQAHITRPGYAIEYDFFDPRDLKPTLETQCVNGLFFAGQINGTTGYEEAGAQGLLAGINAALQAQDQPAWYPRRDESYLGVLVDDLLTCGTQEPYRMFTSRAEYRLLLREDNADQRLTPKAHELGLIDATRWQAFNEKMQHITQEQQRLKTTFIQPGTAQATAITQHTQNQDISHEYSLMDLLKRPEIDYNALMNITGMAADMISPVVAKQIEIQAKYAGYIAQQLLEIEKLRSHEETHLASDFDYDRVKSLSNEVRQKLNTHRPATIGQASRIAGVTPAAISLLLIHLHRQQCQS